MKLVPSSLKYNGAKIHSNFTGKFTRFSLRVATSNFMATSRSTSITNFTKQISRNFRKKSHLKISQFICHGPSEVASSASAGGRTILTPRSSTASSSLDVARSVKGCGDEVLSEALFALQNALGVAEPFGQALPAAAAVLPKTLAAAAAASHL